MLISEVISKIQLDKKEQRVVDTIKTSCSKILSIYKKTSDRLYRGLYNDELPEYFMGKSPSKRKSVNTPGNVQKTVDDALTQVGFKALRSNSIFVTGHHRYALNYPAVYVIFPFNNCAFTWSKLISDFAIYFDLCDYPGGSYSFPFLTAKANALSNLKDNDVDMLKRLSPKELVQKYQFTNKDIGSAMKSCNEIYISGKFVAVSDSDPRLFAALGIK